MPAITIRNVPEQVRAELAARAARAGRSLQEFLLSELTELAAHTDPEDWLARVREDARAAGGRLSAADIVEALDADRR
ncbi:MAG: Antitoxin 1 [Pseudonocardia sp.]|jgi:plasmid stability protein|uniref:FitA-like ribbon-helix-helix domain-containing protein n=1 Tax=Pseudonocardia sp. TaxID=60912 RepID=UPI00261E4706|nr:hypothetical protein [Pseudonocardia sp.]MCU1628570.1 Antitoxin 1 [Pseudonocardia sp.]MDT7703216.1 antitoxin FitA [Pseudonocardiales bacterium]